MSNESQQDNLAKTFANELNKNGFGFHYRVLKEAMDLAKSGKSQFRFIVSELPVSLNGKDTRIDFILQRIGSVWGNQYISYDLICECKRVNPAYSNWLFLQTPFWVPNKYRYEEYLYFESIALINDSSSYHFKRRKTSIDHAIPIYNLAFDIKSDKKGDTNSSKTSEQIENASTQVLRGVKGYIATLKRSQGIIEGLKRMTFIPVVFTTADLFVSDVNLSDAELSTGNIEITKDNIKSVKWLAYQFPMSHSLISQEEWRNSNEIEALLFEENIRTIFIVNYSGIEEFLSSFSNLSLIETSE